MRAQDYQLTQDYLREERGEDLAAGSMATAASRVCSAVIGGAFGSVPHVQLVAREPGDMYVTKGLPL